MKYLLSILLFTVIALAAPVSQNFRSRILYTDGTTGGGSQVEYLGVKDGVPIITKDPSQFTTMYLDPGPRGMLYTDKKVPFYLLPTNETGIYDLRCGPIPKIADTKYEDFAIAETPCVSCTPDTISALAYSPPKDTGTRYEGQFRAYKVGEHSVFKFHTSKPQSNEGSFGVFLVQEKTKT